MPRRRPHRLLLAPGLGLCAVAAAVAGDREEAGYGDLVARLGASVPDGAGVVFVQVEASEIASTTGPWRYLPDAADADLAGVVVTDVAGASTPERSGHATTVARHAVGTATSMAPGVTDLRAYYAGDWIGTDFLRLGSTQAPRTSPGPVQNHSWIGGDSASTADDADNTQRLRRLDLAANRDGFLPVVGLNNGSSTPIPELLAQAYSVVSVGLVGGSHSRGTTTIDGTGRTKPELVAPGEYTSFATGLVSGAALLLRGVAGGLGDSGATRPEVIKAVLLAGADKAPFPGWARTTSRPLDAVFGAGRLDIDASHRILAAGRAAGSPAASRAWAQGSLAAGASASWTLRVPAGLVGHDLSVVATWQRNVTLFIGSASSTLANLTLRLETASGTLVDESASTVDNVEHVWRAAALPEGDYVVRLTNPAGGVAAPYAVAWRLDARAVAGFADWQAQQFGLSAGSAGTLEGDDPDRDGVPNLAEYAFGSSPTSAAGPDLPVASIASSAEGPRLALTFRRRVGAGAPGVAVRVSPTPGGPWEPDTAGTLQAVPDGAGFERVTWTAGDVVDAASPVFVRLAVSPPG